MIIVRINMFGIFQEYFSDHVFLSVPKGATIFFLKKELVIKFSDTSFSNFSVILDRSVFSNTSIILSDDYILLDNDIIYLLPPFSGG